MFLPPQTPVPFLKEKEKEKEKGKGKEKEKEKEIVYNHSSFHIF